MCIIAKCSRLSTVEFTPDAVEMRYIERLIRGYTSGIIHRQFAAICIPRSIVDNASGPLAKSMHFLYIT